MKNMYKRDIWTLEKLKEEKHKLFKKLIYATSIENYQCYEQQIMMIKEAEEEKKEDRIHFKNIF